MIVRSVLLRCPPERAFELFTRAAGRWWPADRRHTGDPASDIFIEPSGRFYERAGDGTEIELGEVRNFDPPHALTFDWYPGTGAAQATRVTVRFESADGGTRVTIEHGPGSAGVQLFARNAAVYGRSWDAVLTEYAAQA